MSETLVSAYRIAADLVKRHDADRHLAALFAPADRRRHLHALQAFSLEVAGIRAAAKEPMPGEIRLQWWRDVLNGDRAEERTGHPIALALGDTIDRNCLPLQPFLDLLEARAFDLYDEPPEDWTQLEGYCGETSSALFRLSSIVLAKGDEPGGAEAAGHAGVAYAIAGLLRAFPWHSRRGQLFIPATLLTSVGLDRHVVVNGQDGEALRAALAQMRAKAREHLARAKALKPALGDAIAPAFLPLAMVEPYLAAMEKRDYRPFETVVDVPQWRRVYRMWRGW